MHFDGSLLTSRERECDDGLGRGMGAVSVQRIIFNVAIFRLSFLNVSKNADLENESDVGSIKK